MRLDEVQLADLLVRQGFLQALAEVTRFGGNDPSVNTLVADILADRRFGLVEMAECGLEPHDLRELRRALLSARTGVPAPDLGVAPRATKHAGLLVVDGGKA